MTGDAGFAEGGKHESPYRQQARLALYFIWGFGALLIGGVFYLFYLIFESNAPGSGFYFLAAMASVGGVWAIVATDMGRSPPRFVINLGQARRSVLGFVMILAGLVSGVMAVYKAAPVLYGELRDGLGQSTPTLFDLLPKTAIVAMLAFALLTTLAFVIIPRATEFSERDIYAG